MADDISKNDKVLFTINWTNMSHQANKHRNRFVQGLLTDMRVAYETLTYVSKGTPSTIFRVDVADKEKVREITKSFGMSSMWVLRPNSKQRYAVFKEDIKTKTLEGIGWINERTTGECAKRQQYFVNEQGKYFTIDVKQAGK